MSSYKMDSKTLAGIPDSVKKSKAEPEKSREGLIREISWSNFEGPIM